MIDENLELRLVDAEWEDLIQFQFFTISGGQRAVAEPLTVRTIKQGDFVEPCFRMSREQTQALFNKLWQAGFRPKDGTGNSGHVAALQYHLEDMRKLVFKKEAGGAE